MVKIESIKKHGLQAKGRTELIAHLQGQKLSRKQAMDAKCYDCMGFYADGRQDCKVKDCPMYGYRTYQRDEK